MASTRRLPVLSQGFAGHPLKIASRFPQSRIQQAATAILLDSGSYFFGAEGGAVGHLSAKRHPIVDARVLRRLRAELGTDGAYSVTFVDNFLRELPGRLTRLRMALSDADRHAAMDAVLSLKTSSRMVGAVCLGRLSDELEGRLKDIPEEDLVTSLPSFCAQDQLMEHLDNCGRLTAKYLSPNAAA